MAFHLPSPLFATFIIGMFWKRMTPAAGLWGLIAGTVAAAGTFILYKAKVIHFATAQPKNMGAPTHRDDGRDVEKTFPLAQLNRHLQKI